MVGGNGRDEVFVGMVGAIMGVVCGSLITFAIMTCEFKKDAVARGYAEYDGKTGQWQWKVSQNGPKD